MDERRWPVEVALAWFDLPQQFVVGDLGREINGLVADGGIDRFLLERALQVNEFAGLAWAALRHGLPRDELRDVLRNPPKSAPFHPGRRAMSLEPYQGTDDSYVVSVPEIDAWLRAWLPRDQVSSTLASHARQLASALGIGTVPCAVSEFTRDPEPAVATTRCIATWDFVALHHSEMSALEKLVTLAPDRVGWHAIQKKLVSVESLWTEDLSRMHQYFDALAGGAQPKSA
jgi:hypothetical protein